MRTQSYVSNGHLKYPFKVTGVRYTPTDDPNAEGGLTLLMAHANGLHKETWQPLISYLLKFAGTEGSDGQTLRIRDIWSLECPNHGESAVLNESTIARHYGEDWDGWEYSRAMLAFLESQPGGVDFYQRDIVAVGHSQGGNSLILLHDLKPELPIISFILLDPTIGDRSPSRDRMMQMMTNMTWSKIDTWPDRAAALKYLAKRPGTRNWHPEVLKLFVEKGLRDHPASVHPPPWKFRGPTLACTKAYEYSVIRAVNHHPRAVEVLHDLYAHGPPVHLVLSATDEFGGSKLKAFLTSPDPSSQRTCYSLQWIEKGGHMFVQTMPEATANAVYEALLMITCQSPCRHDPNPVSSRSQGTVSQARL